ncbi:MAG: hypothetical protein ACETWM_15970 [Candidatus Lokiarchaeia archaeon]
MSKGALLTGTAGGIIGTITMFIGIIWAIVYPLYYMDLFNYGYGMESMSSYTGWLAIFVTPYPSYIETLFTILTIMLVMLLIVTAILVGIGFYGTYTIGGGAMGAAALIMSIIGTTIAGIIVFLGSTIFKETNIAYGHAFPYPWSTVEEFLATFYVPISVPGSLMIWLGCIFLGVTFIVLGAGSIVVRHATSSTSAGMAGGILSIIAGSLLILSYDGIMLFLGVLGFVLLFVAMILWSVFFFSSRYM